MTMVRKSWQASCIGMVDLAVAAIGRPMLAVCNCCWNHHRHEALTFKNGMSHLVTIAECYQEQTAVNTKGERSKRAATSVLKWTHAL